MSSQPTVTLSTFLTPDELIEVQKLWVASRESFVDEVRQRIILPHLERINTTLGQQNDPWYLAYAVQYVMAQAEATADHAA